MLGWCRYLLIGWVSLLVAASPRSLLQTLLAGSTEGGTMRRGGSFVLFAGLAVAGVAAGAEAGIAAGFVPCSAGGAVHGTGPASPAPLPAEAAAAKK